MSTIEEDNTCKLCSTPDSAFVYHHGSHMVGGYGSRKYDFRRLVWLQDAPSDFEDDDRLCDECVTQLISVGSLEKMSGNNLSERAYKKIFLVGAKEMYKLILLERKAPEQAKPLDEEAISAIERLRRAIHPDYSSVNRGLWMGDHDLGDAAYDTGKAHALAAVTLGYVEGDAPDFNEAAETFAGRMVENVEFVETLLRNLS